MHGHGMEAGHAASPQVAAAGSELTGCDLHVAPWAPSRAGISGPSFSQANTSPSPYRGLTTAPEGGTVNPFYRWGSRGSRASGAGHSLHSHQASDAGPALPPPPCRPIPQAPPNTHLVPT